MTPAGDEWRPHPPDRRIFDAHLHIIDPRFPLSANEGFTPSPFTVADYRARTAHLGMIGGAVVSGSFQACDRTYLLDALGRLGPGFVGVAGLPVEVSTSQLAELDAAGVRAMRVNLYRGGPTAAPYEWERLARQVFDAHAWHTEIYVDGAQLADLEPALRRLPRICVDHLGLRAEGLPTLRRLLEAGAYVKATGFGRVHLDVASTLRTLVEANPSAVVFGTDLPSTRAQRPFRDSDVNMVVDAVGEEVANAVLADNAVALYRMPPVRSRPAHLAQ